MHVEAGMGEGLLKPHLCLFTKVVTHANMHIYGVSDLEPQPEIQIASQPICLIMTYKMQASSV